MGKATQHLAGEVIVTDGAWGTQLQRSGLTPGACPDAWNATNPAAVQAVARSYVQAGSQVILTNTFGSNRFTLAKWGLEAKASELAECGAAISRQAAGKDGKVFGSIGPTGKIVMLGDVAGEELLAAFAEQAIGLERGGADAIVCETFTELAEAVLAVKAIRQNTRLPAVLSMTFDSGPDRTSTMMGNSPADVASAGAVAGATVVGGNCGAGPENYVKVAGLFRQATDLPIWIKPNAGLPVVAGGQTTFPMGPDEFAAFVPRLIEAGATYVGGCCGTTPEHIRAVRAAVRTIR